MKIYGKRLPVLLLCFLFLVSGCMGTLKETKSSLTPDGTARMYENFILVRTQTGDTFSSLAARYLGDLSKDWMIREFNGMETIDAGQDIIIPKKPFLRGGLKANGWQTVPVLLYHNFSTKTGGKYFVTQAAFEEQMKYLSENGYRVITLDQFLDFIDFKASLHPKSVLLTFDDGWESMHDIAFPILKKYGFPAALFVYTDFIGKDRAMSWDQIRELAEYGFDIQSHTKTHRNLTKSGESFEDYFAGMKEEMMMSSHEIFTHLNKKCTCLAYPYGKTNPFVRAFLTEHGYRAGFTTDEGQNPFFINNFLIRRTLISGEWGMEEFIKNLDTFFEEEERELIETSIPSAASEKEVPDLSEQFRIKAVEYEKTGELQRAVISLKIAGDLDPGNKEIRLETERLVSKAETESQKHFRSGVSYAEKNEPETARSQFTAALRYDPDLKEAVEYLKNRLEPETFMMYPVENKDTLEMIALKVYHDSKKDFLIAYFNDIEQNKPLKPGTVLRLPVLDRGLVKEQFDAEGELEMAKFYFEQDEYALAIGISKKILGHDASNAEAASLLNASCRKVGILLGRRGRYDHALGILKKADPAYSDVHNLINDYSARDKVTDKMPPEGFRKTEIKDARNKVTDKTHPEGSRKTETKDARNKVTDETPFDPEDEFGTAKFYLALEEYDTAHDIAEKILKHDNLNQKARGLSNESLYRKGMLLGRQGQYVHALEIFDKIPEYPGVKEAISEFEQTRKNKAQEHYRQGVRYFVDEKLEDAVEEWKKALKLDPEHPNAEKEMKNAIGLIRKLRD